MAESGGGHALVSFEKLAEIAFGAKACFFGYLLDAFICTGEQGFGFLDTTFCDVFHWTHTELFAKKQTKVLFRYS